MATRLFLACLFVAFHAAAMPALVASQSPVSAAADVRSLPRVGALVQRAAEAPASISADGSRLLILTVGSESGREIWHLVDLRRDEVLASGPARFRSARMSPDGRYVAYVADGGDGDRELHVRDVDAGADDVKETGPWLEVHAIANDGTYAFRAIDTFLVRPTGRTRLSRNPCPWRERGAGQVGGPVQLSADGQRVLYYRYLDDSVLDGRVRLIRSSDLIIDGEAGPRCLTATLNTFAYPQLPAITDRNLSTLFTALNRLPRPEVYAIDLSTGALTTDGHALPEAAADGGRITARRVDGAVIVRDRVSGVTSRRAVPGWVITGLALSDDGSTLFYSAAPRLPTGLPDTPNSVAAVVALDADNDGLPDAWETTYGLNPSDATDGASDRDADGQTASQEYAAGTHPGAVPVRYFAEGANGNFFATTLTLFNPNDAGLVANVRFLGSAGATVSCPVTLPTRTPVRVVADDMSLPFSEFSMLIEAPDQVVAERRMTWDRSSDYGSHASSGVAAPSTTWHFAEGATISGIQTFFLLQNPGTLPATVTMRYLLTSGTPQERRHVVPAQSRLTVWVNQEGAPMQAAEFATSVQADRPIVAERAVYRDVAAQTYGAGSAAAGVPSPEREWNFAEGATGTFFDTYLLLANPSEQAVEATVRFVTDFDRNDLGPILTPVVRTYRLAPRSRLTVRVADQDAMLAAQQVSLRVTASAPIVAERAMWWPGPTPATWAENHADTGAGAAGTSWAVADVQADAAAEGWDTFLLVDSTESTGPLVRVRVGCEDGTTIDRTLALLPYRVTLWMRYEFPEIVGRRCSATLESLPRKLTLSPTVLPNRAPIRVEKAMYSGSFSAGTSTSGTRLPDPIDPPS